MLPAGNSFGGAALRQDRALKKRNEKEKKREGQAPKESASREHYCELLVCRTLTAGNQRVAAPIVRQHGPRLPSRRELQLCPQPPSPGTVVLTVGMPLGDDRRVEQHGLQANRRRGDADCHARFGRSGAHCGLRQVFGLALSCRSSRARGVVPPRFSGRIEETWG